MESEGVRRRVWTTEQLEQAAALHSHGLSILAIANRLGLTRSTTRRLLVRAGRIEPVTDLTFDARRADLQRLMRHLTRGASLTEAARAAGLELQYARTLIRLVAVLIPESPTARLCKKADEVRAHQNGGDVRRAADALGIEPWYALYLLLATGSPSVLMLPQRGGEHHERAQRMAERRAAGASFEAIAEEFGIGRERARRILLATGGWTPRRAAQKP